eukprot:Clim_evm11s150 gene=Clim_evmTU11s150
MSDCYRTGPILGEFVEDNGKLFFVIMATTQFLTSSNGFKLAFQKYNHAAAKFTLVFFCGYNSEFTGTKSEALKRWWESCPQCNYLRFDYTGHGQSEGKISECGIGTWFQDCKDIVLSQTAKTDKLILVGSSMGGWLSTLFARTFPERVIGLITIAAAPDFTEELLWPNLSDEQRKEMVDNGVLYRPSRYQEEPYPYSHKLMLEGKDHLVLRQPLPLGDTPVVVMHGRKDWDVPWSLSQKLFKHIDGSDVQLHIIKDGDHRLKEPLHLDFLCMHLDHILKKANRSLPSL